MTVLTPPMHRPSSWRPRRSNKIANWGPCCGLELASRSSTGRHSANRRHGLRGIESGHLAICAVYPAVQFFGVKLLHQVDAGDFQGVANTGSETRPLAQMVARWCLRKKAIRSQPALLPQARTTARFVVDLPPGHTLNDDARALGKATAPFLAFSRIMLFPPAILISECN